MIQAALRHMIQALGRVALFIAVLVIAGGLVLFVIPWVLHYWACVIDLGPSYMAECAR